MSDGFAAKPSEAPPRRPSPVGLFVLGSLALLLCLGLVARLWIDREAAAATRAHITGSHARQVAVDRLMFNLLQSESAQRGYVLTGDRIFLTPYAPARRELERLYVDASEQDGRLRRLHGLIAAKFGEMDDTLRLRDRLGAPAAEARVADQQGRLLTEAIEATIADFVRAEQQALAASLASSEQQRRMLDGWLVFSLGAILLCVLTGLALNWRGRTLRYRLQRESWDALVRMRAIFASTTDALLTLNPSGSIETANAATTRLLGYTPEELDRRDIATVIDLAPPGAGGFAHRIGLSEGRIVAPLRTGRPARHKDGHIVHVDVALGAMALADGAHLVVSLRDASERHEGERLKDQFIGTVSHELRTPLTSVIGALGLLRSGTAGALPEQAQRLADIAENNARRLIRLINDILDIDRIGSGRLTLDRAPIDLVEVVRRGRDDAQGLAEQRGVRLVFADGDAPLPVSGDTERLLQVIGNLLSNAIRFSPPGGAVRLTTAHEGGRALLRVSDEGPGVPANFRERLFERFAQSAAGAAIPGGTGLGLAISREIVKAHDGTIWHETAEGGGARFCVALDLLASPGGDTASGIRRVLLCEDDPEAAAALGALIAPQGVEVELCGSAREAQALALTGRYDCVVFDLHLPDASGLLAVRELRAHEGTRRIPLIVVSREAEREGGTPAAHALDVVDWIDKPVDHRRLLDALGAALARAEDGRPTLLHVDDDPDMLEVTAMGLTDRGRMLRATSLAEARLILKEATPDIVILDINLPDGSGLELMPALTGADGRPIPTIIYSASDVLPEVARPFEATLVKSRRSLETLSETIRAVLARESEVA